MKHEQSINPGISGREARVVRGRNKCPLWSPRLQRAIQAPDGRLREVENMGKDGKTWDNMNLIYLRKIDLTICTYSAMFNHSVDFASKNWWVFHHWKTSTNFKSDLHKLVNRHLYGGLNFQNCESDHLKHGSMDISGGLTRPL